jgi:hypothetical protein
MIRQFYDFLSLIWRVLLFGPTLRRALRLLPASFLASKLQLDNVMTSMHNVVWSNCPIEKKRLVRVQVLLFCIGAELC